jgi:seryl-tRNA synthetase
MLRLPNLPHESVNIGKSAEDNTIVRVHGEKPGFAFKPKSHVTLCESLKLVDFERGAKLSGSGFVLYTNWGARLERALIQFMLNLHTSEHGYTEVSPPFVVGPQCLEGVGQFPKFKDQYYGVAEGDKTEQLGKLYLIPTAETPVGNIHRDEIVAEKQLPIHYCAYTPCFRGEAGAAGVGTRGMIRVHQFDKVELIKIPKRVTPSTKRCLRTRSGCCSCSVCIIAWCCCARVTWASQARKLTTLRFGRRGRGVTSKFRVCRIAKNSRRGG